MLRASANQTNRRHALGAVVDPTIESHLEWGGALLAFTDAAVAREAEAMTSARIILEGLGGWTAVVRAAGCVGSFQMMNRLMDTLGVKVSRAGAALAKELDLHVPGHLLPD